MLVHRSDRAQLGRAATAGLVALLALLVLLLLLLLLAPRAAAAQDASRLWYELSVGGAGARLTCDLCTPTRDVGAAASIAMGAYASPHVRVGVELSQWTYKENDVREHLGGGGIVAHLVPDPARKLYLLGGLGWTRYRAGDFTWSAPRVTVGVGYDVPAFGRWVVGNVIALDGAAFGALRSGGNTVLRNVGLSSVRASVQLRRR